MDEGLVEQENVDVLVKVNKKMVEGAIDVLLGGIYGINSGDQ